ncbi:Ig-like domain-containing protein [Chitinophaga nivalis]|uniref:T9SS type A sorting domain-containing protein n=1 Tax=Chitinophaga nivalis TaxID=2991709 RepID=A0ABT3IJU2_9BACT|nr:T9SS type A sorting domain-containing protein [Chitinophaga nivalis]MCW3466095.1 T9SS type A sorting domain-containing protein [Chitinophaga nivalis]MCW3484214.1 T9SS type A sorting domain-containing protein [Chitinophaga nivalis]
MKHHFYFFKSISLLILFLCLCAGKMWAQTYATSQTNGTTGLCLLCSVSNPDNAIKNDNLTDYSAFNIPVGLLGVTVYQSLIFPAASIAGCDSLIVGVGNGGSLLAINLLAGVSVQTFNGSIANPDSVSLNSNNVRILGSNQGEVILKPAGKFDRVKITLSSSILGLLTGFRIYYAYHKPVVPVPAGTDSITICAGSSTALTATIAPGSSLYWYNAATGGTLLYNGNNYTVSPATTTTYYAEARAAGCVSTRKAVKVIVHPRPAKPVYSVPQDYVCGSTTLQVSNHTPGNNYVVNIHFVPLGRAPFDTAYTVVNNNLITTPVVVFGAGGEGYVNIQAVHPVTGCKSDTAKGILVYGISAKIPTVNADSLTICKGDTATFIASNEVVDLVQFLWYDAPQGGNLLYTGSTYKVSPAVTTTYYVAAKFNCEFPTRKAVKVIVKKLPDPIYTVPQGIVCGSVNTQITNHQPGYHYRISIRNLLNGTLLRDTSFSAVNTANITLPAFLSLYPTNALIFIQAIDPVTTCRSDTARMAYIQGSFAALPNVDADTINSCKGTDTTLHAYVPGFTTALIYWYTAPAGGTLLYTGNYYKVRPASSTTYYVTAGGHCEYPKRRPVRVNVLTCPAPMPAAKAVAPTARRLKIFPNPNEGTIAFGNDHWSGSLLIIRDNQGREVQREVISSNTVRIKATLPNGAYFIQVITREKQAYSTQMILLR